MIKYTLQQVVCYNPKKKQHFHRWFFTPGPVSYVWNRQGLRWVAATRETALLPARNIPRCCFFRVGFGGAKWERESFSPLKKVPDSFKRVVRVKYRSSKNKAHSNFSFLFCRWHLQLNQKQNGGVSFALPSLPCQQQKSSDPKKKDGC